MISVRRGGKGKGRRLSCPGMRAQAPRAPQLRRKRKENATHALACHLSSAPIGPPGPLKEISSTSLPLPLFGNGCGEQSPAPNLLHACAFAVSWQAAGVCIRCSVLL